MKKYKFSKDHQWINYLSNKVIKIGITDYAQKNLGDIIYIEKISPGKSYNKGDIITNIESVKSVSDIYTPISGQIIEFNQNLLLQPEIINLDPYKKGWIVKMLINQENIDNFLMNYEIYQNFVKI